MKWIGIHGSGQIGGATAPTVSPPAITTSSPLLDADKDLAYSATLEHTVGSGTGTWSIISGALPSGLMLNSSTGEISGTPTVNGSFNFTAKITDAGGSDSEAFALTVNPGPPEIS